ncbi:recombinase family protein [Microbacterium sp.]|uniref:recombinase family protein n=1 Tax=Microbacterium sp. TaxID=51671 RepID=UPI003242625E
MTSQRIGYSRVSTGDQNPDSQADALRKAGVDQVHVEKFTGTKASRPVWDEVRRILRPGDTLVITRLDRLGRSSRDLIEIAAWLEEKGVALQATEQPINTSTPEGKMFYTILSAFAQFERDMIAARTKDGLAAARARGRKGGRKAALTAKQVASIGKLYSDGSTVSDLAEEFRVSRPTVYRALGAYAAQQV